MRRRRDGLDRWLLMVLGVLLVLGHVCELPTEALLTTGHAEAGEHDSHGDSIHAGSCEAVTTAGGASVAVPLTAGDLPLSDRLAPTHNVARGVLPTRSSPSPAPALFLLHLALLI